MNSGSMVITTTDTEMHALELGKMALDSRLASCVQIIPGIRSLYLWKGKFNDEQEFLLHFKTTQNRVEKLMIEIKNHHSYETPEIISFKMDGMDQDYGKWLQATEI